MTDFSSLPPVASLDELRDLVREFNGRRDWAPYHTPKNLAMSVCIEAAELAEHFQWLTPEESMGLDAAGRRAVAQELADVLIYLVTLADTLEIDLLDAARHKLMRNHRRYPEPDAPGPDAPGTDAHRAEGAGPDAG